MSFLELYKNIPESNKIHYIEDMLPKNPKFKEQASELKDTLITKGFICEFDLEFEKFEIIYGRYFTLFDVDVIRAYHRGSDIVLEGYDFIDGITKFTFSFKDDKNITFQREETEVEKGEMKHVKIVMHLL